MRITIAERLRPYSHLPGIMCLLPGSCFQIQIFPCLLRIYHLASTEPNLSAEICLEFKGPVKDFTVLNNLEKGYITVWGYTQTGFIRYHLFSQEQGRVVSLYLEKAPEEGLKSFCQEKVFQLSKQQYWHLFPVFQESSFTLYQVPLTNRLSLGNHKAQDWDLIKRRLDFREIFPIWNRLGQLIPIGNQLQTLPFEGIFGLLKACQEIIDLGKPEEVIQAFTSFFQAGFHGILVPRLFDYDYQGLIPIRKQEVFESFSPFLLLTEGMRLIHRLFIQQNKENIWILPCLPPELFCGRLLQFKIEEGMIDLEWSKKTIRRMIFYSQVDQDIHFHFKKQLKFCRIRENKGDKGYQFSLKSSLVVKKNCYYFFDNFM